MDTICTVTLDCGAPTTRRLYPFGARPLCITVVVVCHGHCITVLQVERGNLGLILSAESIVGGRFVQCFFYVMFYLSEG